MYILKNAWISITRNKGRNILMGIIIFVIACASTVTLAIQNTAHSLITSYRNAYQVEATIGFNRGNMKEQLDFRNEEGMNQFKEQFENMEPLTVEQVLAYADSNYVKNYYYTISGNVDSESIEKVSSDFSFQKEVMPNRGMENIPNGNSFTVLGYSSLEAMEEFITGNYTIKEVIDDAWNLLFTENYGFINSELAELNDIGLNDVIELVNPEDETVYTILVAGIYEENSEVQTQDFSMFSNSANMIITSSDTVEMMETLSTTINPTFILEDYSDATKWQEELYEKGLNEYYTVTTNEEEVTNATSSISNVATFATTFLVVTLIIGVIVLFVINQINVRERKYEIGVLRTIGMKKIVLTFQFVIELSIVAFVSLLLGAGLGAMISKPVSNSLLSNEIKSSQVKSEEIDKNFGGQMPNFENRGNGVISVQAYDSINAVVSIEVLLELLAIGIGLTLISSLSSLISIQKFSPLQILKERS